MPVPEPKPLRAVVATHGHCFDGMCSAAMFTRLLRHVMPLDRFDFTYHAAGYGPGQNGVDPKLLDGDVNAILDFRFSALPQIAWYFDHHVSAFPSAGDVDAYKLRAGGGFRTFYHDAAYGSCTKLIADMGLEHFQLDLKPTAEMVGWADMIDSAAFPSAEMAVARTEPVLGLMTVVEHQGDDAFLTSMVPRLLEEPLEEHRARQGHRERARAAAKIARGVRRARARPRQGRSATASSSISPTPWSSKSQGNS